VAQSERDFYVLSMFPYPSGNLHMGHVRVYTLSDTVARFHSLRGRSVLHPMGWDAFGLPAENAAIERGIDPAEWTESNIRHMRTQLDLLGCRFDWDAELTTCQPDYYRWTQALFVRLHAAGLVYRAEAAVNWDPVDKTVLANEQVDTNGRSWRSGAIVERRSMTQWFVRITARADQLLGALDELHDWPKAVRELQRLWIGRSDGALINFPLLGGGGGGHVSVFSTRPETITGATFVAISPSHALVAGLAPPLRDEANRMALNAERRVHGKTDGGFATPLRVRNPITGDALPVYVASYVLGDVGTGAVMGVPAHDERDAAFAAQHALPVSAPVADAGEARAASAMTARIAALGAGAAHRQYRLRDWLISRQRAWGTPIPAVHCGTCGPQVLPESALPVPLAPRDTSSAAHAAWLQCACPKCGGAAERERDTMDTFVDSAWYWLRYNDARNAHDMVDARKARTVDVYIGGVEHAVMHLLYARFVGRVLHELGYAPEPEPFKQLVTQGMVVGRTFRRTSSGGDRPVKPAEVRELPDGSFVHEPSGDALRATWEKMSKSKYNGVDPVDIVTRYGADCTRLYVLFKAPIAAELAWDEQQVRGQARFVARVHRTVQLCHAALGAAPTLRRNDAERALLLAVAAAIDDVVRDTERLQFNTAIAHLMTFVGALASAVAAPELSGSVALLGAARVLTVLLSPFAPHVSNELWCELRRHGAEPAWAGDARCDDVTRLRQLPDAAAARAAGQSGGGAAAATAARDVSLMVHVNGRFRGRVSLPDERELEDNKLALLRAALTDGAVRRALASDASPEDLLTRARVVVRRTKPDVLLLSVDLQA
jgi:leucyl-tRNA synthetase